MVTLEIHTIYQVAGEDVVNHFPALAISKKQLHADNSYFYGVLQSVFLNHGKASLHKFEHTFDGIMVWVSFLNLYDNDSMRKVSCMSHKVIIAEPFSDFDDSLTVFTLRFEESMVSLSPLGLNHDDDNRKSRSNSHL